VAVSPPVEPYSTLTAPAAWGTADGLKRSADSKVGEPVVVEVSRRQRPAERIKGL